MDRPAMKLTGDQIEDIQNALLDAYPSEDDLLPMVRIELDENLEAIATGKNQRVLIFNLVTWAERTGRVDALLQGAHRQNPGNPLLSALMQTWQPVQQSAIDGSKSTLSGNLSTGPASIDVFLSYSRENSDELRTVQDALRAAGLAVWTDERLKPGTEVWQDAIEEAIHQAQAMVVLLSPEANASRSVKNEIGFAQVREKPIFPILVSGDEATSIPISLITTQWVDGREDLSQAIAQNLLPAWHQHFSQHESHVSPAPDAIEQTVEEPAAASAPESSVVGKPTPKQGISRTLLLFLVAAALVVGAVGSFLAGRMLPFPTPNVTKINPRDSAVYVYVPAGPFVMGSSDGIQQAYDDEKSQQKNLDLGAFWIMRTEVTNAQYNRCVQADVCSEPDDPYWGAPSQSEHPVTAVDWYQANKYAEWVGGRLPTEAEWEKACRGTDGRIYPWGDDLPTAERVNYGEKLDDTTPVGSYPAGASPYGVLDMAGNVWEWTSSKYADYPYKADDGRERQEGGDVRVLRGGSWFKDAGLMRCAHRTGRIPSGRDDHGGFRVVLSP